MRMEAGLDTGPVAAVRALPIADDDTAGTLSEKLAALGAELLARDAAARSPAGRVDAGARRTTRAATLAPLLTKADGRLDFDQPARVGVGAGARRRSLAGRDRAARRRAAQAVRAARRRGARVGTRAAPGRGAAASARGAGRSPARERRDRVRRAAAARAAAPAGGGGARRPPRSPRARSSREPAQGRRPAAIAAPRRRRRQAASVRAAPVARARGARARRARRRLRQPRAVGGAGSRAGAVAGGSRRWRPSWSTACCAGAARLDRALERRSRRSGLDRLDPRVRIALRVGGVSDPVPRSRAGLRGRRRRGRGVQADRRAAASPGFANALLRRLARQGEPPLPDAAADPAGYLVAAAGLPAWLAALLLAELPGAEALAFAASIADAAAGHAAREHRPRVDARRAGWRGWPRSGRAPRSPPSEIAPDALDARRARRARDDARAGARGCSRSQTRARRSSPSCAARRPASGSSTPAPGSAARPRTCWRWPAISARVDARRHRARQAGRRRARRCGGWA